MSIKISIVVPVYNVEKYLRQCLDSIINQSFKDIEIICVDDGSTDSCPSILAEYAVNDSRLKVITKHNSGYGNTMNVGISYATGDYLGIVESDDYIDERMYEILYQIAKEHDLDIAKSLFTSFDNETGFQETDNCDYVTKNKVICPAEDLTPFLTAPSIWAAIYKLKFINNNDIKFQNTPGASYQDTSFFFKTNIMSKKFMLINESLLHYRVSHATSSSTRVGASKMFCVLLEWEEVFMYIKEKKLNYASQQIAYPLKYAGVPWLVTRLDNNFKYEYLVRIQSELKKDIPNINMDKFRSVLSKKKVFILKIIKLSPRLFMLLSKYKFLNV